jgi:asparagine synthase (glutamine-hydrolysing)
VRAPFLDYEFLSWGLRLPASLKIGAGGGKHILKRALEPLLGNDILYRPKQGFTSDLAGLFRGEMHRVRDLLLGPIMLDSELFDAAAIRTLLDQHAAGAFDHAQVIWLLLAFEGFLASLESLPETRPQLLDDQPLAAGAA